jgi:hypothetical protein
MEIGAILIVVAILIFVIGFIIKPLMEDMSKLQAESPDKVSHLLAERDRLMTAILELDFDNELGKVPEDVFKAHREDLSSRTVAVMKELEKVEGKAESLSAEEAKQPEREPADEIEKMINARRAAKDKTTGAKFCSECGSKIQKGDNFCMSCGKAL